LKLRLTDKVSFTLLGDGSHFSGAFVLLGQALVPPSFWGKQNSVA